ncbi:MAG: Crp/Fnr family transcriptional regulator [Vicingaceae bacterium]|nr:Crp/Fnr family transcriptional regulator [Vicingaceae bacterium]
MKFNNKINCIDCENSNCFIKKHCLENEIQSEKIHNNKFVNRYTKNQLIFMEGNFVDSINFIQSGRVKVFKKGAFGKDQIIRLISNGEILGHRGLSDAEKLTISATSITDSLICSFDKPFFFDLLKTIPELTLDLMLFFANELNHEETKVRDLSIFNVREKVAKALLIIINAYGLNEKNEINYIKELSRQDIAELVGLNSNQVTKVLADLKDDKIIETINKKIKITQLNKLKEIVNI